MKLDRERLRQLTDSGSWDRGIRYFQQGRVSRLVIDADTVTARVMGTHEYTVELWADEDRIHGECTCPMGDRGIFCKHCVATSLECLEQGIDQLGPGKGSIPPADTDEAEPDSRVTDLETIRDYLRGADAGDLVEMLLAQAKVDDRLLRRLVTRAAANRGEGPDLEAFKRAVDEVTWPMGFVEYGAAHGFAASISEMVDEIENLLQDGYAEAVVRLSEYAIGRVEGALAYVDDSDGWVGGILPRLQDLHHRACVAADPDPRELAERLFMREVTSDYDTFYGAVQAYADVLGKEGLDEYRRLAEEKWQELPQREPGDKGSYVHGRYALRQIMESLAEAEGDVQKLVAIKSRDLSHPYNYLDIAEVYRQDRQYDKAMEWAEKGMEAFPERPDPRLGEFLANEYHRRGRHAEAMELAWARFDEQPCLETYKHLKEHADRVGEWPGWRERALALMTTQAESENADDAGERWPWQRPADGTELVRVYLWEKAPDAAWETAQQYGCWREQWLKLASLREQDHPRDAVQIYQREVARLVELTKNAAYREATRLVRRIRKLMAGLGAQGEFEQYLESLRTEFKRKRNFMKMLADLG